ncbi:hypothetical protein A0130_07970 [Leifsonia xyli]|nr:hypothetical protein A0130_07970 [Leifsonia xyli]
MLFGKPRIRHGVVWLAMAVVGLFWAITGDGNLLRYLLVALWTVGGATMLTIAVRDLRHGRGAYASPTFDLQD